MQDAIDREDYVGAGLEAAGIIPVGGAGARLAKKALPDGVSMNRLVGDAYRDHVADFFRQNGLKAVTDAQNKKALSFDTPHGPRVLDIAVYDKDDNLLGYIETKSGGEKVDPTQRAKDDWLRQQYGITIDYVYDDMLNLLY